MKKSVLKKPSNTKDVFGAFLLQGAKFSKGKYDFPIVKSNIVDLPTSLYSYQRVGRKQLNLPSKTALHFYVYDYVFDGKYGVWNALIRGEEFERGFNLGKLDYFDYLIAPDYSLYLDMPVAWQMWNVYRNRVVTFALQKLGYKVIVNVRWADKASYSFCFEGIEEGTVVAVGSYGCSHKLDDRKVFEDGLEELILRIKPKTIIFYGPITDTIQTILEKHDQDFIAFQSDTSIAMEESTYGNESK